VQRFDIAVIGAGFFGAMMARELARTNPQRRVILLEREATLLARASRFNQARLHGGYHYPRSFLTAYRARQNYPKFSAEFAAAVVPGVRHHYAIARHNSKVASAHFERFAHHIGAPLSAPDDDILALLDLSRIEALYAVDEQVFDANVLARLLAVELQQAAVTVALETQVDEIHSSPTGGLELRLASGEVLHCARCYNATYAALDQFDGSLTDTLKIEAATLLLLAPPAALSGAALTIMDGPFFSFLPFPTQNAYSLSHVRYTPQGENPTSALIERIRRDVARLAPGLTDFEVQGSWTEKKCVLARHEIDDGRPILFKPSPTLPGLWHVLGAKLDNVYDVLAAIKVDD
jgi:glycine/D-amino acid oxidase-like deaminating enzyme